MKQMKWYNHGCLKLRGPEKWRQGAFIVIVKDVTGREILSKFVYNGSAVELPVFELQKGLYFLSIQNKEGQVISNSKFVKN